MPDSGKPNRSGGGTMKVEFIYDADCPNVHGTRENLLRAFQMTGTKPHWVEWDRSDTDAPEYTVQFGSPTLLINGRDIEGIPGVGAASCRIYRSKSGAPSGVPKVELIAAALQAVPAPSLTPEKRRVDLVAAFPAVALALLPKVACPACWPAYAGIVSALGIGFVLKTQYLLPLTVLFLAVSLSTLLYKARVRGGVGPFILGFVGAIMIVFGKFTIDSDVLVYSGVGILIGASLWKSWPRTKSKTVSCCNCAPAGNRSLMSVKYRML